MIVTRNSSQADSYYQLARASSAFTAVTNITGLTAYSTAAGTGGPLLWNNTGALAGGNSRVLAIILGVSVGWTTAPAATGQVGITWNSGQSAAPTTTTAITGVANNFPGAAGPLCNVYNKGTVTNAGVVFLATHSVSTAATPVNVSLEMLDGLIIVPPGCWAAVAAAATISTMVANISLIWAEIPL